MGGNARVANDGGLRDEAVVLGRKIRGHAAVGPTPCDWGRRTRTDCDSVLAVGVASCNHSPDPIGEVDL